MKSSIAACTFAIICASTSGCAEQSPPVKAPLVDPSTVANDRMTCNDDMGYPDAAVRSGAVGVSVIEVEVAMDGQLTPLEIAHKSGPTREHRLLDQAAFWHFAACRLPSRTTGEVVRTVLTYTWKLE